MMFFSFFLFDIHTCMHALHTSHPYPHVITQSIDLFISGHISVNELVPALHKTNRSLLNATSLLLYSAFVLF